MNSGFEPIKVVSWQKAILLWLQNRVEVLEYHSVFVNSATQAFPLPAVIRLQQYIKPYFSVKDRPTRQQIFKRDKQTCQYCKEWFPVRELTIDHVNPLSKGGKHTWENVVTACSDCNNKKGSKSLRQLGWNLLKQPTKPALLIGHKIQIVDGELPDSWRPFLTNLLK